MDEFGAVPTAPGRPLAGVRVLEVAGLGPVPFCAMLLSRLGADVLRVERPAATRGGIGVDPSQSAMHRGRRSIALDLKAAEDKELFLCLLDGADLLLEGLRPGAMERLGLGPEACHARKPTLTYARIAGWARGGPDAAIAGHDINYSAGAGLLAFMGPAHATPTPPLTLGADFPGGLLLALRCVAELARPVQTRGAVVDQSLVGAAMLLSEVFSSLGAMGLWRSERGVNALDGGAPYYRTYRTSDHGFMAVGALEEPFYQALLSGLGLEGRLPDRRDAGAWGEIEAAFTRVFASRTRAEWTAVFEGSDACVTPVLHPLVDADAAIASSRYRDDNDYWRLAEDPAGRPRPRDWPLDAQQADRLQSLLAKN